MKCFENQKDFKPAERSKGADCAGPYETTGSVWITARLVRQCEHSNQCYVKDTENPSYGDFLIGLWNQMYICTSFINIKPHMA